VRRSVVESAYKHVVRVAKPYALHREAFILMAFKRHRMEICDVTFRDGVMTVFVGRAARSVCRMHPCKGQGYPQQADYDAQVRPPVAGTALPYDEDTPQDDNQPERWKPQIETFVCYVEDSCVLLHRAVTVSPFDDVL
jgi:hypothetical protein